MSSTSTQKKGPAGAPGEPVALDPVQLLKGIVSLRRLTGMYPAGHPMIAQKLAEVDDSVQQHLRLAEALRLDIIHGAAHLDGISYRDDSEANAQILRELTDLTIDSLHIRRGVDRRELHALSELLWHLKEAPTGEPIQNELTRRGISHISLGRLVPLDTRWRAEQWPEAPTGVLDPAYEESLLLTRRTFEDVAAGRGLDLATVRDVVGLLIRKVAGSRAALAQILAVKMYENLTYCHSVNVATLSLLLARQLGLDDQTTSAIVEAALLHDIGKTRIPLDVLKKPGALDRRERKLMEAHTTFGAEILVEIPGLRPLAPTVALEHHRTTLGSGYPDLGEGIVPHPLSQLVSVADIYEAITGARSYQDPLQPEQACLVLARLAGTKLNTALVKAFVTAVGFFPVGSIVRTNRDELGVVVRTNPTDPLHPVIVPLARREVEIDTSTRDASGEYERHIIETLPQQDTDVDLREFLGTTAPSA